MHNDSDSCSCNQYKIAVVRLAYTLAGQWQGNGSGPTFPDFWLTQVLGDDFDRSILDLYQPAPTTPVITQECTICHKAFHVPTNVGTRTMTISQKPVCPVCATT